jgi:predicted GH43/DUF377 family glycosyl hydrolase
MVSVTRTGIQLRPDSSRVLIRAFQLSNEQRVRNILSRILTLTEAEVEAEYSRVNTDFSERHVKEVWFWEKRYNEVRHLLPTDAPLSETRQLLIGSYFTMEYALEAAALFNPSIVWHPDQSGLPLGTKRFIISLRATGEGHISSIVFRTGIVDNSGKVTVDVPNRYVTMPDLIPDSRYEKKLFIRKLEELDLYNDYAAHILESLPAVFTLELLRAHLKRVQRSDALRHRTNERVAQEMLTLALSNYEIVYTPERPLSERIIFPYSPSESNGIEDARFVQFTEDDGSVMYYATYTAYNGRMTLPQILETKDFLNFNIATLNGSEVQNKGMALFPRRIQGHYAMISRQDNENIYLMYSDYPHFWYNKQLLLRPTYPWEYIQLGNCGSPIETDAGWLVLSHGVGPMRRYSIGAFLLDKDDPSKVIGRMREPLLTPNEQEREGYVPNVVYSCGAVVHNGLLILPYAMSDYASSIATVPVAEILAAME